MGKRTPLYRQIQQYILDFIKENNLKSHNMLPSENEMAARFNVSRITVRKALDDLIERKMIYRIQGKGTFIAENQSGAPVVYESPKVSNNRKLVAYLAPRMNSKRASELLSGIEDELFHHGYQLLFCKTHDSIEIEKEALRKVMDYSVDGIIVYPLDGEIFNEEILRLSLNDFPVVVIDRYLRGIETNCVCANNFQGAYEATKHLLSLGHSQIAFISTRHQGTTSIEDRLAGYEKALADHNIPITYDNRLCELNIKQVNEILEKGSPNQEVVAAITAFLQDHPAITAVFATNTNIGLTVLQTASKIGMQVPRDLALIFFDDYEFSNLSNVIPTIVDQKDYQVGKEAAKLLLASIENPSHQKQKIELQTQLVIRQSTIMP